MEIYVTLVGTLAMMLCIGSYLMRSHSTLTWMAAAGVAAWSGHFALQEAWTASALSLLMSARIAAGVKVVKFSTTHRWAATVVGWALTAGAAALTWAGPSSAPSTLASLFTVWAGFHLHYRPLRLALLVAEVLWFLNGWVLHSAVAMAAAVVAAAINITMLWHEGRRARPKLVPKAS